MFYRLPACCSAVLLALALTIPASAQSLPSRENDDGHVMVTVTPLDVARTSATWRFDVRFNTHVSPITQDMMAVTDLSGGKGHSERPAAWQGDPPGGHHRKGVLLFKGISPYPATVTVHIREVGGVPDRTFTWNLTNP